MLFFYQNFRLLKEAGDYFANEAVTQPLLHLWSLAIEEQFYIVFPLIATFVWWFSKRSVVVIGAMVAMIVVGSFVGCLLTKNASVAFYFPLTRFWEIGVGMGLAYVETFRILDTRRLASGLRNCLSIFGFLLIVGAMWFYTTDIITPSWYSLFPVFGTAFLIAAHEDSVINRTVLTWKLMIFVGLISYSLYLWHWPLISFLHIINPKPEDWMIIVALGLSFVLSILVYVGVENPMRRYKGIANKYVMAGLVGCLALCFGAGQVLKDQEGFVKRPINVKFEPIQVDKDWTYPDILQKHEINSVTLYVSDKTKFPEILFIGDSHVEQYAERALLMAKKTGKEVGFLSYGACFVPVGHNSRNSEKCRIIPKSIEKLLLDSRLKTVVLGQIWGSYLKESSTLFDDGMKVVQSWVAKNPDKQFFVLLDSPWDKDSYDIRKRLLVKRWSLDFSLPTEYVVDYPAQSDWKLGNEQVFRDLNGWVSVIETETKVCPNKKCDLLKSYRDADHLRASYVRDYATWIDLVFE